MRMDSVEFEAAFSFARLTYLSSILRILSSDICRWTFSIICGMLPKNIWGITTMDREQMKNDILVVNAGVK